MKNLTLIIPAKQEYDSLPIFLKELKNFSCHISVIIEDNDEKTIFRSKAVGEPPLLLAISHFLALKEAIKAASKSSKPEFLNSPATPSEILKAIYA